MFGNQISYTSNGIGYVYYTYRPDGLRHSIGDKVHLWDGANIVADVDGNDISVYIRGANLIYADDGNIIYYHFNAHGDVVALTNENGTKTKSYAYSAFGVEYTPIDFDDNPFRYCGEYFDKETNTIYLRARYYNAEQGRFTQEDPIRDGDNWYSYCDGNPIMFVDPSGNKKVPYGPWSVSDMPPLSTGYIPPKRGNCYSKEHIGYIDKYGNIWRRSTVNHGINRETGETEHWDVSTPDGNAYINVYPDGTTRGGKGKVPGLPKADESAYVYKNDSAVETYPIETNSGNGFIVEPFVIETPEVEIQPITENNSEGVLITPKQIPQTPVETIPETVMVVGLVFCSYCIIKWGVALITAVPTGGVSIGVAAVMP